MRKFFRSGRLLLQCLVPATLIAVCPTSAVVAQCTSGTTVTSGGRDYVGCNNTASWANARTKCQNIGTGWDLASISSSGENTTVGSVAGSSRWIGFNDIAVEGTFAWSDGTTAGYTSWNGGEPNDYGGNEDCTQFVSATVWNDMACSTVLGFVCEGPAGCGNKWRSGSEACDDGNTMNGDGCSSTCTVEAGWTCNGASPTTCYAGCPAGGSASTNGGYDYVYCSTNSSWTAARDYCDAMGAAWDLVWIDTTAENNYVRALSGSTKWIGFNDRTTEGSFIWTGSHANMYTNWNGGEPNDYASNEDCTEQQTGGGWNDNNCANNLPFVCKSVSGGCGNGAVLGGEACDDGDNDNGDGCSSTCTIETGYSCTGSPSVCTPLCTSGRYRFRTISGMPYTYREYYVCDTAQTQTNAETICGQLGTGWKLAAIGSSAENTYITGLISGNSWIGFNDKTTEGSFVWSNAESVTYTNWNGGEPNDSGGNEDCTELYTTGFWNDENCGGSFAFVCEQVNSAAKCGNRVLGDSEHCDDGNVTNGDGCSSSCLVENGYSCTIPVDGVSASVCTMPSHVLLEGSRLLNVGGQAVLEWKTASEAGALGFFVSRLNEKSGKWEPLHDGMLVAPPTAAQGAVYRLLDRKGSVRGTALYHIEEYDSGGRRVTLEDRGFAATVDPAVRLPAAGFEVISRPLRRDDAAEIPSQGGVRAVRAGRVPVGAVLPVSSAGAQAVSVTALAAALGRSVVDVTQALSDGQLSITDQGHPVAWSFDADADAVVFVGEASNSAYSATRPYMFRLESGVTLGTVNASGTGPATVGLGRTVTEVEHDTFAGLVVAPDPDSDYWFDAVLSAGSPKTGSYDTHVTLAAVPAEAVRLTIRVYGAWNVDAASPQQITVLVNGQAVGEFDVAAVGPVEKTFSVPAAKFVAGKNTLSLAASSSGAPGAGGVYVDGFTVDAVTELDFATNHARFAATATGPTAVIVDGGDVRVFDVTAKQEIVPAASAVSGATEVRFVATKDHDYVVAARSAFEDGAADLRSAYDGLGEDTAGGDLLIVAPHAFREAADALAALRTKDGLKVQVVELEDLWDRFGGGLARPTVITDVLREAMASWKTVPRYMVLIGDGTFDYRNVMGVGPGAMPPLMVKTSFGLYASDSSLADLNGDGRPDLATGRLPAHTPSEAKRMVARLAAYGARDLSDWEFAATLVAGKHRGVDFSKDVTHLSATLPTKAHVRAILTNGMEFEDARNAVLEALDEGAFWFDYEGHGGLDRLDDDGLITASDVNALTNGELAPIVTGMTCSISRYEVPGMSSLGDSLVLGDTGGAIAVWAPTGVSTSYESAKLSERFGKVLFRDAANEPGRKRLGDIVLRTHEEAAYEKLAPADMLSVFTLLGDPSMKLPDLSSLKEPMLVPETPEGPPTADGGVGNLTGGKSAGGLCAMGHGGHRNGSESLLLLVAAALLIVRRRR